YRSWYKCPYTEYLRGKGLLEKYEEAFKEKYAPTVPGFLQPSPVEAEDAHDVFITREAANWIRSYDQEKPFFLWLNFVGPHSPLDPPEPYASMYKPEDMPPPIKEIPNNIPETIRVRSERFWQDHSVEEMQQARAYHYGMVSLIDDQVGRLIEALRENGRYENTIIVFTSDHGVNLGDHGVWGKHVHFKGTINAPLVVSWPGKLKKKKTVDRVVERQDLAPTFLEVAGADGKQRQYPFGESLMPFLTGKGNYVREEAFVEDETATTVVTNRYKYIYSPDWETPMLFDMTERPEEVHNLALENPELLNEMRDRMLNWLVRTHDHPNSSIRHTHRKVGNPA
ncbi:sulfatase-like hydrolase/transferase, partial [bacterium]|nr:sulfatase-like hydrolase/transferase [bacterium]